MAKTMIHSCFLLFFFCFLHNQLIVNAILDPTDFLALQSIRKALEDMPGSDFFSSWDFTADPCNFSGVFCDSDKVISLNLGDPRAGSAGLTGRIDPAIGKLSSLAEFTVVPGRIYGPLPQTISSLKNLRFLGVNRNFISGEIPAELGELRSLRTIDLSYNQLTGKIPPTVGVNQSHSLSQPFNRFTSTVRFSELKPVGPKAQLSHRFDWSKFSPSVASVSLIVVESIHRLNGPGSNPA